MCGIVGKVHADIQNPIEEHTVRSMCDAIIHRGPDEDGFFFEGGAALGMRRLQVIDLAGGHQPIENEDGSCALFLMGKFTISA